MKCLQCNKEITPTEQYIKFHPDREQKFCEKQCREKHWRQTNKDRVSEYAKQYRREKTVVQCAYCTKPIPYDRRGQGIQTCSYECTTLRAEQTKQNSKKAHKQYSDKIRDEFHKFKTDQGCSVCGYNKYGGSLDFHHLDPDEKEGRVSRSNYLKKEGKNEIKKCILVCKNCHYEIHGGVIE